MTGSPSPLMRQGLRLEVATIAWNCIEAVVAVASGIIAASVALTGFGVDSAIEVVSAILVLRRLRAALVGGEPDQDRERRTLRLVAGCFVALATYLVADGATTLASRARPDTSPAGIVITALALLVMPVLGFQKVRAGRAMGSALLVADAAETWLCAAMALATLISLALYAGFSWRWVDPTAGFVIAAVALWEAREAWEGELDEDRTDN
ncbi:MAG: cation transporter [Acidimicrobiales bacterium]